MPHAGEQNGSAARLIHWLAGIGAGLIIAAISFAFGALWTLNSRVVTLEITQANTERLIGEINRKLDKIETHIGLGFRGPP